jgi:hypothetical protein
MDEMGGAPIGLGCIAIAGYSGQAYALGLPPPFTNDPLGWRKAKATYEKQSVAEDDASGESRLEQRGKD